MYLPDTVGRKCQSVWRLIRFLLAFGQVWSTLCCVLLESALARAIPKHEQQCFSSSGPASGDAPILQHLLKFCVSVAIVTTISCYATVCWAHCYCFAHPLLFSFSFPMNLTTWLILANSVSWSLTIYFQTGWPHHINNSCCAVSLHSFPLYLSLKPCPKRLSESWNRSLWVHAPFSRVLLPPTVLHPSSFLQMQVKQLSGWPGSISGFIFSYFLNSPKSLILQFLPRSSEYPTSGRKTGGEKLKSTRTIDRTL